MNAFVKWKQRQMATVIETGKPAINKLRSGTFRREADCSEMESPRNPTVGTWNKTTNSLPSHVPYNKASDLKEIATGREAPYGTHARWQVRLR